MVLAFHPDIGQNLSAIYHRGVLIEVEVVLRTTQQLIITELPAHKVVSNRRVLPLYYFYINPV